jgi:ferredoxin
VLGALGCGLASSAALALAALGARRVQAPPPAEPPQTELTDLTPAVFVNMFDTGEEPLGLSEYDPGEGFVWADEEELQPKSKDIPSHKQLDYTEDGEPVQLRFAYVDEGDCIGCTYCADIARGTFFMHEEAGRARVFDQGGDQPDVVMEAIDACPVNCISFVDLEDLQILETEREGQVINQAMIGVPKTWQGISNLPPTKAKLNSGRSMVCCNNCPGKGCQDCPMYGIGQNPTYLARLEERQAKKEASGEAAREREELRRQEQLDALNGDDYGMAAFEAFDAAFAPPPGIDDSMLELGAADSSGVLAAVNAPELTAVPDALDASDAAAELESRLMQRAKELEAELLTIAMRSDTQPR